MSSEKSGLSRLEITLERNTTAEKFFLSKHTVVSHRRKMMKKTNTNTITELLSYVRKTGLIED